MENLPILGIQFYSNFVQTNLVGASITTNGKDDCVELINILCTIIILSINLFISEPYK